ncbi:YhjD/YihY/BrkB family envelope integrity protein, partial [uncultured Sphingomonas sp.]
GNYGATYGSLSAVIVTLTWLWLSAYVFLLGAELNAELERQVEGEAPVAGSPKKDSPVASRTEPSPTNISEPVGIVASLAGSGAIATAGLALLRRGRPFGAAVIAMAALSAWRKRPGA